MDIEVYEPISTLKVEKNLIYKSKYPFVDIHNHQFDMPIKDLSKLVNDEIVSFKKVNLKKNYFIQF